MRFAQGDDLNGDQANFSRGGTENIRKVEMPHLPGRRVPVEVDALDAANGWGLGTCRGMFKSSSSHALHQSICAYPPAVRI